MSAVDDVGVTVNDDALVPVPLPFVTLTGVADAIPDHSVICPSMKELSLLAPALNTFVAVGAVPAAGSVYG